MKAPAPATIPTATLLHLRFVRPMPRMLTPSALPVWEAHRRGSMATVGLLVSVATAEMAAELAAVAAVTFPLACPPSATPGDVAAHIAANLSEGCFAAYVSDPDRRVFAARERGRIIGYAILVARPGEPSAELSKMYVLPSHHGVGAASALMRAGIESAAGAGAREVWLGVNQGNLRAQRFYGKHGFEVTGTRSFRLGDGVENDFIMTRPI